MWDNLILVLLIAVVILAVKFLNWVWFEPKRMEKFLRKQGLNGNSYRFFYGDVNEISNMYKDAYSKTLEPYDDISTRIMPFIKKSVETYGKISFAWIGPKPRIIISDVELIKTVLNKYKNFQKSFGTSGKIIKLAIGGLGHYEGEKWSKSRMLLNPAFHVDKLKQKIPGIQECVDNVINRLKSIVSNDESSIVDVTDYLEDLSGATVTQTLFSTPYSDKMRTTFNNLRDITILTNTATKPFNFPGLWYLPTKRKRKAFAMEKQVRELFTFMINERLMTRKNGGEQGGQDLLDLFLDELYTQNVSNRRVRKAMFEDVMAQCKMFYFAGFDTTSNLLVWTLVTLASHQNWQARAREEVFQVLGNSNSNKITNDNVNHLKVISMILYEVLRLYPPVMELSRVVEEDTNLGGYHIPKGVSLQLTIGMLHRSSEIWGKDVHEFKPDRFADGMLKATGGQVGFMPFSRGPRICIGQNFALMESKVFLAQFLRAFSFELSPTYKHAPNAAFTVQPEYGAPLVLHKL